MPYKDPEVQKRYDREKYQRNKEKIKKRSKVRYHANPEKSLQANLEWHRNNRERYNAYHREWRKKQTEEQIARNSKMSREWCRKNAGKIRAKVRLYQKQNPEKTIAHAAVRAALYVGFLVRPKVCDICGKPCKPHAHHADYSKMLEVTWPCPRCHKLLHIAKKTPSRKSEQPR
jgi:hypothetical protein